MCYAIVMIDLRLFDIYIYDSLPSEFFLVPDFTKALRYCHIESSANICIGDPTESRIDMLTFLSGLGANSMRTLWRLFMLLRFSHPYIHVAVGAKKINKIRNE